MNHCAIFYDHLGKILILNDHHHTTIFRDRIAQNTWIRVAQFFPIFKNNMRITDFFSPKNILGLWIIKNFVGRIGLRFESLFTRIRHDMKFSIFRSESQKLGIFFRNEHSDIFLIFDNFSIILHEKISLINRANIC